MENNLVVVQYRVYNNDNIVVTGSCPTYFVNTVAHMYLIYDDPDNSVYIEFEHNNKVFKIYAPTL